MSLVEPDGFGSPDWSKAIFANKAGRWREEPFLVACNCPVISVVERRSAAPVIPENSPDFALMILLAEAVNTPTLDFVGGTDFVVDKDLLAYVVTLKRWTLILSGGQLEEAITQITLAAALENYDAYVCGDLIVTAERDQELTFLDPIHFRSGHIVTARQILLELLSQENGIPFRGMPLGSKSTYCRGSDPCLADHPGQRWVLPDLISDRHSNS